MKRVLVHLIDATHVRDGEVENCTTLCDRSVEISRLINNNLDLLGFLEGVLDRLTAELADFEVVDQSIVVENGVWVGVS